MAVGVVAAEGQERHYGGRITTFVVLSCMTAGMGGVIFGYDIGIAGGVSSMEPFLRKFFPDVYRRMRGDTRVSNYCKFDSQLLTAFTSSLYVAGLLTTFLASRVTAGRGRRASMVLGGGAFLAGAAVGGASELLVRPRPAHGGSLRLAARRQGAEPFRFAGSRVEVARF